MLMFEEAEISHKLQYVRYGVAHKSKLWCQLLVYLYSGTWYLRNYQTYWGTNWTQYFYLKGYVTHFLFIQPLSLQHYKK